MGYSTILMPSFTTLYIYMHSFSFSWPDACQFKSQSHQSDTLYTSKPSHSSSDFILSFPLVSPNDKLNCAFPHCQCLHQTTSLPSPPQFVHFLSFFPTVLYHTLNTTFKRPIPTCMNMLLACLIRLCYGTQYLKSSTFFISLYFSFITVNTFVI